MENYVYDEQSKIVSQDAEDNGCGENIILSLSNINKSFPGVRALHEVGFNIVKGEVHCIIGENGAGKSTLMKILSGEYTADSGEIYLNGEKVRFNSPEEAIASGIGTVYQELSNFSYIDVASNLFANRFPKRHGWILYNELYKNAKEVLDNCGLLQIDPHASMEDLSLGSQQMVEIAKLISCNAQIVILDEPTSALTEAEVNIMYDLIADMKKKGRTILYISHKLNEILKLADHITVLKDGEHVITVKNSKDVNKTMLVKYMVGRDVIYEYEIGNAVISDEKLLEVKNLNSGKEVQDISFGVRRGEVLGFAGLEGSGRTELFESIFGWRRKSSGEIYIKEKKCNIRNTIDARKNRIAYITKDRKNLGLFLKLDVQSNMAAASNEKLANKGIVSYSKIKSNANLYIKKMQIKVSDLTQKTLNLSGGNQQKVLLGMWLSGDPDILLIDEPTRGIDVGAKSEIHEHLRAIAASGKAVVIISSELPELMAVCDRMIIMHEGRIVGEIAHGDDSEEKIMRMASGMID